MPGQSPSNQILLGMADGSGQSFNAGLAIADVRAVGAIHALAVDHGEPGARYAIGHNLTFKELARVVTALTGKQVKHFGGSKAVAKAMAGFMEMGAKFTSREPALTRALIDDAGERYMFIDSTPTWQTFQYTPYSIPETVRNSLEWFVTLGKLPPIPVQSS